MSRPNRKRMTVRKALVRGLKPPYGLYRPLVLEPLRHDPPDHRFAPGEDGLCSRWLIETSRCSLPAGEHDG